MNKVNEQLDRILKALEKDEKMLKKVEHKLDNSTTRIDHSFYVLYLGTILHFAGILGAILL